MKEETNIYNEDNIKILEGLEAVEKDLQCILEMLISQAYIILFMK